MRVGASDVANLGDLVFDTFCNEVERAHRIDESQWSAFLTSTVVTHHHDDGVVELSGIFKLLHQACEMIIKVFEHCCICSH